MPLPFTPSGSKETVLLRVAGVRYAIPANYLRYPVLGCDTEESGFLLRTILPTMEGYSKEKAAYFSRAVNGVSYWTSIHVSRFDPGESMNRNFSAYARGADRLGDHPTWQGLLQTKDDRGDDIFYARDDSGNVMLMIDCGTQERVPYPSCRLLFPFRGSEVAIIFARPWLEDWRSVQASTEALLNRFSSNGEAKSD